MGFISVNFVFENCEYTPRFTIGKDIYFVSVSGVEMNFFATDYFDEMEEVRSAKRVEAVFELDKLKGKKALAFEEDTGDLYERLKLPDITGITLHSDDDKSIFVSCPFDEDECHMNIYEKITEEDGKLHIIIEMKED